ncbi:CipC1 protein [Aspergillus sclerotiicarbonarius CBS 121057]|uniref:CipC1 protein n=1 Tax=Aspergillus sclerotiicarbonarius (strain CBS 121057 / IBT 28362) TaxID=1448318 RepID=A0A319DZS8_ASPSB|nr:CipC1 protein [Aspergillus sclerotiicarbonarius CBS 121057]
MAWFSDFQSHKDEFDGAGDEHKAKLSHEVIGGAAAYEAMKSWEEHQAKNGKPDNHAQAKEILAGLAGAFIDKEFEEKGIPFAEKEKMKYEARKHIEKTEESQFDY